MYKPSKDEQSDGDGDAVLTGETCAQHHGIFQNDGEGILDSVELSSC